MRTHDHPPEGGSIAEPLGDATEALAAAWRATRAPEIGTALVAVSEAYASFFPPLPKRGERFDRVLRAPDRMLSVLLRAVVRGGEREALRRLRAIADVAGDDPRLRHHLRRWAKAYRGAGDFSAERARLLAVAELPATGAAPADLLEQAAAILASLPRRRAALRLLRDVYAHPADLALRQVLADALLELGDPWGELITLQSARARGEPVVAAREEALLAAGATAWLGRLARVVAKSGVVFEEGFPAVVDPVASAPVRGIPEWSTVRALRDRYAAPARLRSLRLLTRTSVREASALVVARTDERVPVPEGENDALERLGLRIAPRTPQNRVRVLRAWSTLTAFPRLARLDLPDYAGPDEAFFAEAIALRGTPLGRALVAVGFQTSVSILLRHALVAHRAGLTVPRLYGYDEEWLAIERDLLTVHLVRIAQGETWPEDLAKCGIARVRLEVGPRVGKRVSEAKFPSFVEVVRY